MSICPAPTLGRRVTQEPQNTKEAQEKVPLGAGPGDGNRPPVQPLASWVRL